MNYKSKKAKSSDESRWEKAATAFESEAQFDQIAKASRVLTSSEERELLGSGKTKQISLRLPEKDLQTVKEIASATDRPYQQLMVLAIQQYIDKVMTTLMKPKS